MKSEYTFQKLKGRIKEYFNSQSSLAEEMNLSTTALSNKLNGRTKFNYDEIISLVEILKIKKEEVFEYFFNQKVGK